MASDRTEQPTSRRLREARKKGQLPRSKDATDAAALLATMMVAGWFGGTFVRILAEMLSKGLVRMSGGATTVLEAGHVTLIALDGIRTVVILAGPFALAAAVTVVAFTTLQGGWNVAPEALGLQWSRLNPVTGAKRLVGRLGIDTVKMFIAVTVVTWLSWNAVQATIAEAPGYGQISTMHAATRGWSHAERLLRQTVIVLAVIGVADFMVQRWRLTRSLRMTKQEVRDDLRLAEGNPEVKARIRRLQRDTQRRRMLAAVPKATVVITNPTEYAVALEYRRDELPAPRVIAKGKGPMAARIRALARQHEIPVVENVPLAQSLYRAVDVGEFIPADLFGAVAEVLAYLIRLNQTTARPR